MSLKAALEVRGVSRATIDKAVENTEKVLAQVIVNASKNTTNAQAMRSNSSSLKADLDVLYGVQADFVKADKAVKTRKLVKPADEPVAKAPEVPEVTKASEADKG